MSRQAAAGTLPAALYDARRELGRQRALLRELREIDRDRTLNEGEAKLLRALLHVQAGHEGRERVTRATLATWTGLHPLSIPRIARRLEAAGRIVRRPCFDRGGRQSGNQWILGPVGPGGVTRTRQRAPRSWSVEPSELPGYPARERAPRAWRRRGAAPPLRGNPSGYPLRARAASPLRGGSGIAALTPDPGASRAPQERTSASGAVPDPAASGRGGSTAPGRGTEHTGSPPASLAGPIRNPRIAQLAARAERAARAREDQQP